MMKKFLCFIVSLMMILPLLLSEASEKAYADGVTNTYWVSPNGTATWTNARHDTPLEGTACASITTANLNAAAGDTVYIRGGTYTGDEFIKPSNSGTSWENQIVFSAYNNETVTVTNQICPNRSHEDGAWTALNGAVVTHSTDEAYNGDYSTRFTVTEGLQGVRSDQIPVRNILGYVFSAWVWSDQPSVNVCMNKGDDSGVVFSQDFTIVPGKWNMVAKSKICGVAGEHAYIAFRSPSGSTSGTLYVDNVRIHFYQPSILGQLAGILRISMGR